MIILDVNKLLNRYFILFNIWNDSAKDERFVRKYWQIIVDAKLAQYSTLGGVIEVKFRILALAIIYREINSLLFEESSEIEILLLTDELQITRNQLINQFSQILDVKREVIEQSGTEPEGQYSAIINRSLEKTLIIFFLDRARNQLIKSLMNYYHQDEVHLFLDMKKCLSGSDHVNYEYNAPIIGGTPEFFNWIVDEMPNTIRYE